MEGRVEGEGRSFNRRRVPNWQLAFPLSGWVSGDGSGQTRAGESIGEDSVKFMGFYKGKFVWGSGGGGGGIGEFWETNKL